MSSSQPTTTPTTTPTNNPPLALLETLSNTLNCGLDRQSLQSIISLIEAGVKPEAVAEVVKEIRRERDLGGGGGVNL